MANRKKNYRKKVDHQMIFRDNKTQFVHPSLFHKDSDEILKIHKGNLKVK